MYNNGITIDEGWFTGYCSSEVIPFVANQEDQVVSQQIFHNQMHNDDHGPDISHDEKYTMENLNPGGYQTKLKSRAVENVPHRVVMVPGECRRPVDIIMDTDSEELAFTSIYCGKKRSSTETYSKYI